MNDLLKDTFHDQVARLDLPALDLAAIEAGGRRRRNRRRTAIAALSVAALAVVGIGAPQLLGGGSVPGATDPDSGGFAPAFASSDPAYALAGTVHLDGRSFDVGRPIWAMTQTSRGIVFLDRQARVWTADGASAPVQVGQASKQNPRLWSDGSLAAWNEIDQGRWVLAAVDQADGQVQRLPLGAAAGDREFPRAGVRAVAGDTVYYAQGDEISTWQPARDTTAVLGTVEGDLLDVKAGRYLRESERNSQGHVSDGLRGGVSVGSSGAQVLSPDGRYLLSESSSDEFALYDTASGAVLAERPRQYSFFIGYRWTDRDSYVAMALDDVLDNPDGSSAEDGDFQLTLLNCTVGQECAVVVPDAGSMNDGIVLPIGEPF